MNAPKLVLKPVSLYGRVNAIGVHVKPEGLDDVSDALEGAERDDFERVYVYVNERDWLTWTVSPWIEYGRRLNDFYSQMCEALTFKQFKAWQKTAPNTFRARFTAAATISKRESVQALARDALSLVHICEREAVRRKAIADAAEA